MIKRIALVVVILSLSLAAPALAAEDGIIEGLVVNGTEGGSSVANQEITLDTHLNDAEVALTTTETDAEGHFFFDGLSTEPGYSYDVVLTFQGADYYSEWLSFAEGETTKSTEVVVYDSTTSDEAIKVTTAHTIIYVWPGSLEVIEYLLFSNESDRTYIGSKEVPTPGGKETLRISLPKGATELQYGGELMGCCVVPDEEGFIDSMPVLPTPPDEEKLVAYSYIVSYSGGEYTYSQRVNYPMSEFSLLVQGETIGVASDQLVTEGLREFEGSQFNYLSGTDLASGDILDIHLSGLPGTDDQGIVIWITLALVVLGAGFGFSYLLRKKRLQPVSPEDSLDQRSQRLLAELAQLDDDFETGKISEENYRKLRSVRKAQLAELIQSPKEKSGSG